MNNDSVLAAGLRAGRGTPAWSRALVVARRARIRAALAGGWSAAWRFMLVVAMIPVGIALGIGIAMAVVRWWM